MLDIVREIKIPVKYYEGDASHVTLPDELWGKLYSFAITNRDTLAELPSVFEDGMKFKVGEAATGFEDEEVLIGAADSSVEVADDSAGTASLQTRYDRLQAHFDMFVATYPDTVAAAMSGPLVALHQGGRE